MTHGQETSPLAQAFAAIIAMLIAAIAEHAREHPMLGGPCRASIRQLEKIAKRFEALANEYEASRTQPRRRAHVSAPPPPHTLHITPQRPRPLRARRRTPVYPRQNPARAPPPARRHA